jgi:hypothetical protein
MNLFLLTSAILAITAGVLHSVLGERYVIKRIRRVDLGARSREAFLQNMIRGAWHLTSFLLVGFGAILLNLGLGGKTVVAVKAIVASTFLASSITSLIGARGKHFSWILFAAIALLAFIG